MHQKRPIIPGFVVFEGIDGTGTTTQLHRIADLLRRANVPHRIDAEPTKGPIGQLIRTALSGNTVLHAHTVAHLFAADRNEHLFGLDGIQANCMDGKLVVSDRYLFSSLAYQGLTCGTAVPERLNQEFPLPQLLFFFSLPADIGMERMKNRQNLEIYEKLDFQTQVAAAYGSILAEFENSGMQIIRINAALPIETITQEIWCHVEALIKSLARPGGVPD